MSVRRIYVPATLSSAGIADFQTAWRVARQDEGTRIVVLHGDEETFCRGADLESLLGAAEIEHDLESFASLLEEILTSPVPIVAEVAGHASGGGVGIVAAADVVVASEKATFALTEALFGVTPAIIAPALLRRMSRAKVSLWATSCHEWASADAVAAGLADEIASPDRLERQALAWARRLARAAPSAVAAFKQQLSGDPHATPTQCVPRTANAFSDPAVHERIRAFYADGVAPWAEC